MRSTAKTVSDGTRGQERNTRQITNKTAQCSLTVLVSFWSACAVRYCPPQLMCQGLSNYGGAISREHMDGMALQTLQLLSCKPHGKVSDAANDVMGSLSQKHHATQVSVGRGAQGGGRGGGVECLSQPPASVSSLTVTPQ